MKKSYLVFILIIIYFTIPKIDLFTIPGIVTGVRLQDFISLLIFIILINYTLEIKFNSFFIYIALLANFIFSIFLWKSYISVIGFIRIYEYFIIAKGLFLIIETGLWRRFFNLIYFYLLIFSIGQYFKLFPVFDPGRGFIFTNDFAGPFGTSAELTYFIISFLFLNYLVQGLKFRILALNTLILLNGVKAGLFGIVLLFMFKLKKINFFQITIIFSIILTLTYISYDSILVAVDFFKLVFEKALNEKANFDSIKTGIKGEISELSLGMRLGKWGSSLSLLYQYPLGFIFGFGLYSQGGALDGGLLRFIYELGLTVFVLTSLHLYKISISFLFIIIAVSMFFDSYMSSVVMPVLICTYLFLIKKRLS